MCFVFIFQFLSQRNVESGKTLLSEGLKDEKGVRNAFIPFPSDSAVVNTMKSFSMTEEM